MAPTAGSLDLADPAAAQLAAMLEALPDPLLLVAGGGGSRTIIFANSLARELFSIGPAGGPLLASIRNPQVLAAVDRSLTEARDGEALYRAFGVQERFWRAITRPLRLAADDRPLALLVLRDETDAKRNESIRADFLANASHELRTPLASLSGFIETLRGHAKDDPDAQARFLGIMAAQAERMGRLIADLLSLSRIEMSEHIPPEGDVDLLAAARDVIDSCAPVAETANVRLELAPSAGPTVIVGEQDQIVQVVQNLIENAVKYSPSGCRVEIALESDLSAEAASRPRHSSGIGLPLLTPDHRPGERYASVTVTDHGPGIARSHLPRLSERFYRAEGQKSGSRSGTGLGLAIVKHIVNRHHGGLIVESEEGEGAMFTAYFPQRRPGTPS